MAKVFSAVLSFLTGSSFRWIAIFAVVTFAGTLVYQYRSDLRKSIYNEFFADLAAEENKKLNDEIVRLNQRLKDQDAILERARKHDAQSAASLAAALEKLSRSEDAPVSQGLKDAIDDAEKMP